MDHEEKYKESLEKARIINSGKYVDISAEDTVLEYIFPELKESEDEKIRKEIISALKNANHKGVYDKHLAWLEKQCNASKKVTCTHEVEVGNGNIKALVTEEIPTDMVEPKFKVGDWITNGQLTCKVLSVTSKSYELHLYNDDYCHFETDVRSVDEQYHRWAIEDARDGDVLANDHHILILKELGYDWSCNGTPNSVKAYCGIKPNGNFEIGKENWCFCGTLHIHPATKEQCGLLFQMMKKVGYEWDADKKELMKIEQKPIDYNEELKKCRENPLYFIDNYVKLEEKKSAWSEEDEQIMKEIAEFIYISAFKPKDLKKKEKWLTWFNKQGKKLQGKSALELWKDMRFEVGAQASGNRHEPPISDNDTKLFSLNDIDEIMEKITEKQSSKTYTFSGKSVLEAINEVEGGNRYGVNDTPYDYENAIIAQKDFAPKEEPKFHEGEWLVHNDANVYKIQEIRYGRYELVDVEGDKLSVPITCKYNLRPWKINDAKDGDVLVIESGRRNSECLFIFKDIAGREVLEHSYYRTSDNTFSPTGSYIGYLDNIYHPATKEQRDLLFSKMKEAGYEWDAEKKEPKKIKDKHTCELDNSYTHVKFPFKAKVKSSGEIVTIHDGQLSLDSEKWINYQSDAEDGYKIYEPNNLELVCEIEQNSVWSEEDEKMLVDCFNILHRSDYLRDKVSKIVNWLQSIKQRIGG